MGVETPGNPKTWRLGLEMSHFPAIPRPTSGTYKKQAAGQLSPLPGKAFPGRGVSRMCQQRALAGNQQSRPEGRLVPAVLARRPRR